MESEASLAVAVGWALIHSLWQGAMVASVLAALCLGVRSPRVKYAGGCAALLLVVVWFGLTVRRAMPVAAAEASAAGWVRGQVVIPGVGTDVVASPDFAAVVPWLTMIWIFGVAVFYARHLTGWISIGRLRRRGVCTVGDEWQRQRARLCSLLGVSRTVQLLESCFVDAPIVMGHLRPVILMPIGLLASLPASQVEAILLHELAHVRRHDYLVNLVQRFVEGLFFYHPAVWWISSVIRAERENCCDDVAVAVNGDVHGYASALAVLEVSRHSSSDPETAMAARGGSVVMRIQRLLYPKRAAGWAPFVATVLLMATGAIVLPGWQQQVVPFVKWLNEDVVYIIAPVERTAFLQLTTDTERERFVEQFWLQRDPTPGTVANEFKQEHYRRIAYSNDRFAGTVAGWRTDRGHMYILYGPADEIESHPSGGSGRRPWDDWLYYHIDGVGERVMMTFVEEAGEYRMTRDPRGR